MIKLEAAQLAARIKEEVKTEIDGGLPVCLAAVRVGDDPASAVYVRNKIKACEENIMRCRSRPAILNCSISFVR